MSFANLMTRRFRRRIASFHAICKIVIEFTLAFLLRQAALKARVPNLMRPALASFRAVRFRRRNRIALLGDALPQSRGPQFFAMCFRVAFFKAFVESFADVRLALFFTG